MRLAGSQEEGVDVAVEEGSGYGDVSGVGDEGGFEQSHVYACGHKVVQVGHVAAVP